MVGARCTVADCGDGTVRFYGPIPRFGLRIGVELDTPRGLNDGALNGKRYFRCAPKCGLFVVSGSKRMIVAATARPAPTARPNRVVLEPAAPNTNATGAVARSEPSNAHTTPTKPPKFVSSVPPKC